MHQNVSTRTLQRFYIIYKTYLRMLNKLNNEATFILNNKHFKLIKNYNFRYYVSKITVDKRDDYVYNIAIFNDIIMQLEDKHMMITNFKIIPAVNNLENYLLYKTYNDSNVKIIHLYDNIDVTNNIAKLYSKLKLKHFSKHSLEYRTIKILLSSRHDFLSKNYTKTVYKFVPNNLVASLKLSI